MTRQHNSSGRDQINIEHLHGHLTIFNHDRKEVAGPNSEPDSQGIPHNLTLIGAATFVGREDDMNLLHEQLQQGTTVAIAAVAGMGGVGKTELALQYALRHLEQQTYAGGICWLAARQDVGIQLLTFARSGLDLQPPDDLELVDRVRWCWQRWEGSVLLVLDDVQEYQAIQPYLPPNEARFKVVLTSRSTFGSPVRNLELRVLTEWAALELLRSLVTDGRIDEQLEQAKWICGWLGCLPLGLELVGRYLAQKPDLSLEKLRQRLEDKRLEAKVLKEAHPEMTATLGVAAAFELSWQELDEQAQKLAMLLSLFALAEIPWELVQACLPEWDEEELEDLRDLRLVRLSLLERTKNSTYQLHQLLREFFAAKLEPMKFADDMKRATCAVLVAVGRQIPSMPTLTILAQVAPAIPHLKEAATALEPWLTDADLLWTATGLGRFYEGQSAFAVAKESLKHYLKLTETRLGAEHPDVAIILGNLAHLYQVQGRYSEAESLYLRSLSITQDSLGLAIVLGNLAGLYQLQGRYSEAEPLHLQALTIHQQQLGENHPHVATSLSYLAALYQSQERHSEAESLYLQAMTIYRQQLGENHPHVATSLNNLAYLYKVQGRYSEAEPLQFQSLSIKEQQLGENHPYVATSLDNLAQVYYSQARYSEAEPLYLRSLSIREQQLGNDHPDVATSLNNLALLYESQRRYLEAEPLYLRALAIWMNCLGADHPSTKLGLQNFLNLLQQAIQAGGTAELSDHPTTQSLLQQLQADH